MAHESRAALDFCAASKLTGMHIVLKFDEEKYEIVLAPEAAQIQGPGAQRPRASA